MAIIVILAAAYVIAEQSAMTYGGAILGDLRAQYNPANDYSNSIGSKLIDGIGQTIDDLSDWVRDEAIEKITDNILYSRYNRPSYKKVGIDMSHIESGHGPNGNRGPNKDRFPWWMTSPMIEKAVREAYRNGDVVERQFERIKIVADWGEYQIVLWYNTITKTIESAWPKY